MKIWTGITVLYTSVFTLISAQCAYYPNLGAQMFQFQSALQAQINALAGISGWNTVAAQSQYMNQLATLNNQLATSVQNMQSAFSGYPGCNWNGYPFNRYTDGIYDGWTAQRQYWQQLQGIQNAQTAWNPSIALNYATSIQQQQAVMVQNAQAIQAAWGAPYLAAYGNTAWNLYW